MKWVLLGIFIPLNFALGGIDNFEIEHALRMKHTKVIAVPSEYGWYQHHFYCLLVEANRHIYAGSLGATKSATTQRVHCRKNASKLFRNPERKALSKTQYRNLLKAYEKHTADHTHSDSVIDVLGAIVVPFTWGHSKPCYREKVVIDRLIQDQWK